MKAQKSDRVARTGIGIAMTAFECAGFAFREQKESDYGIDAHAELIEAEKPTGQLLGLQLKSGPSYLTETYNEGYVFRVDSEHVDYWLNHALPVLVCLCDIEKRIVYWQIVNDHTANSTGKGYRFNVPFTQTISPASTIMLKNHLTPIIAGERYTIFKTDDTSHGAAKRYSFEVVINGKMSKAEVATLVRQLTYEGQKRRYHRNHMVKGLWGDSDAHVVWTLIYPSAEDHRQRNYICRSIWVHEDLDAQFRPVGFDGENVGDNIIVDWSSDYDFLAEFASTNTLSKEDYLEEILPRIEALKRSRAVIEGYLRSLSEGTIDEHTFLKETETDRVKIDSLYNEISDLPIAPYECREVDTKLESFIASLHNIWLFYCEASRENWDEENRLYLSLQNIFDASKTLEHLEYELSKIH